MVRGVVVPAKEEYDLHMDSNSSACTDVQRGLELIKDDKASFTVDGSTDALLKPFMSMFQFERIKTPYHIGHVLLLLYAPFGVILLGLRLVCAFSLAFILPKVMTESQLDACGMHKLLVVLSGTIVTVEGKHLFEKSNAEIVVVNHISEFDAIALRWIGPAYVLGYDFYKKMLFFRLLGDKFGLVYVPYASRNQGGAKGRDEVREIIIEKLSKKGKPLAAFPEGGLTNGRKGLLQYHKFLFSLGKTIQPLAIQASDGPFPVNINDETSTFLANVLWYLFIPWHHYRVKCLPPVKAEPNEDPLDFAQCVMKMTAEALAQQPTPFLYRDKISFTRYKTKQINKTKK
uniref:Phospholipid/glycerol acyltransferase domain-containing protein n=1 Tax=Globisporangium ultimum (strain ATCC 200006 / CBS 805.95 / DAOM BR144) TaxID=431595 RepID=K3W5A5_GLOUD